MAGRKRKQTIAPHTIHRWRVRQKNIFSYAKFAVASVGVSLVLFLVVGVRLIPLPDDQQALASTFTLWFFLGSLAALLLILLSFAVLSLTASGRERSSIGKFLVDPEIPYEQKRSMLASILRSGFHPAEGEEQLWYSLVTHHWADLYPYGTRVLGPVESVLRTGRFSPEGKGSVSPEVEHLTDLLRFLGEHGTEVLMRGMDSGEEQFAANSVLILGELRDPRALEPLGRMALSPDNRDRFRLLNNLAFALGRFQDPRSVEALFGLLASRNEILQQTALQAMRAQGKLILLDAMRQESDPNRKILLRHLLEEVG